MKGNGGRVIRRFFCSLFSLGPNTDTSLTHRPLHLPQVAEMNIPQQMDEIGE
jgi:hypothetical protein